MKTFKWTVSEPRRSDPRCMGRREYSYWSRVRARGPEWFVVQKGLLFFAVIPAASELAGGPGFSFENAALSWLGGLCAGTLVWMRRESRFGRARDEAGLAGGDDSPD